MQSYYIQPASVDVQAAIVVDKEHIYPTRLVQRSAECVHHPLLLLVLGLFEAHQTNVLTREQDCLPPVECDAVVLSKGVHVALGQVIQQTNAGFRNGVGLLFGRRVEDAEFLDYRLLQNVRVVAPAKYAKERGTPERAEAVD